MDKLFWGAWVLLTTVMASYFGHKLLIDEDKSALLIGDATYGHYQIEMSCDTCHTDPFGGRESLQAACVTCHAAELEEAHDSHPKKKFTDPRNADRIEILDARYCVTCHTEHQREQTHPMGVTLPTDYCFHCHQDVGENRVSHVDLPFDSCASAGCHNYHDNRAIYEDFLVKHADQSWLKNIALIPAPNAASLFAPEHVDKPEASFEEKMTTHPDITEHWAASSHAQAGVRCGGCHTNTETADWLEKPGIEQCRNCHKNEVAGFVSGKHGMRLSDQINTSLGPVTPGESHLPFREDSLNRHHGCNSCHAAHDFDTRSAAMDACLSCHNDEHSLAFAESPHGRLWQLEKSGSLEEGGGVSCATCHMPRVEKIINGKSSVHVEHNQNASLRPNEKMIRPVCMQCHSLEFAIDSLADPELIKRNFTGQPAKHVESIDWALKRIRSESGL